MSQELDNLQAIRDELYTMFDRNWIPWKYRRIQRCLILTDLAIDDYLEGLRWHEEAS